jgi:hypothetical protein
VRHGSDRVCAIQPQRDTAGLGLGRETGNVEELPRAVENGGHQVLLNPQLTGLLAAIDPARAGPTSRGPRLTCWCWLLVRETAAGLPGYHLSRPND